MSAGVLYACKGAGVLYAWERKKKVRKGETDRERDKERERDVEYDQNCYFYF